MRHGPNRATGLTADTGSCDSGLPVDLCIYSCVVSCVVLSRLPISIGFVPKLEKWIFRHFPRCARVWPGYEELT